MNNLMFVGLAYKMKESIWANLQIFAFALFSYIPWYIFLLLLGWGSVKQCVSSHLCMNVATFRAIFVARLSEIHYFGTSYIFRSIYAFWCIVEAGDGNVYPATSA